MKALVPAHAALPAAAKAAPENTGLPRARLWWVDNLRTFVILLVLNIHACVTYSHVGSWYIMDPREPSMHVKIAFFFWEGHLQAFFMGLLFFVSGVFATRSLERRGPASFLRERLYRLGIPSALYMLLIHPFMTLWLLRLPKFPDGSALARQYLDYISSGRVLSGNGPLWFAPALLLFSAGLAIWRATATPRPGCAAAPSVAGLVCFGAALVLASFLIRTVQPIGTNVLNFQLCFFPQYIAAFAAGAAAGRNGWFDTLAQARKARTAGWLAAGFGPLLLALVLYASLPIVRQPPSFAGGWNPQAFGFAFWEQLTGLGIALGLLYAFRARLNFTNRFLKWAGERSFAVYVLHAPVLVALTLFVLPPLSGHPFLGAPALTIIGLILSFAMADLAKRTPGLRSVL